jgi:hypothetical protein
MTGSKVFMARLTTMDKPAKLVIGKQAAKARLGRPG